MHILINITSCGTLIGQAITKTAFAVTLLKLTKNWGRWILWFCIATLNLYMVSKVILQWAKVCDKPSYDVWYRLDICLEWRFRDNFKEGGNVYNIIMDFVLAVFPWVITWNLDMRRVEKIGLCVAMSLVSDSNMNSPFQESIADCPFSGHGRRRHIRNPHKLERRRQPKGRMVLLAQRPF